MKRIIQFSQKELINRLPDDITLPTKGVCFRLTFKWAGCTLCGGNFQYGNANPVSTAQKHSEYRAETLKLEAVYGDTLADHMEEYTLTDWNETRKYVGKWATSFTCADKQKYSVRIIDQSIGSIREYFEQNPNIENAAILAVFYGKRPGGVFGHVVGYCSFGGPSANGPCFFDSNSGLWEFSPNEDKGKSIMNYIKKGYINNGRTITDFNTIALKR